MQVYLGMYDLLVSTIETVLIVSKLLKMFLNQTEGLSLTFAILGYHYNTRWTWNIATEG